MPTSLTLKDLLVEYDDELHEVISLADRHEDRWRRLVQGNADLLWTVEGLGGRHWTGGG